MRYVNRKQLEPPASLTDPDGAGMRELKRAQDHYGKENATAFSFSAYKSKDVVDTLAKLFNSKCAYCESKYVAVQPMDVEHYRPKGAVFGAKGHPGYWWLAAEWTNLLPSCIDCNRRRYHDLYRIEAEGGDVTAILELAGKQDLFPIAGQQRAACSADSLADEDALLIDPCQRDPAAHLTWASSDPAAPALTQALAHARVSGQREDPYARASIDVYGLNRSGLVDARTDLIRQLEYDLQDLQLMIEMATLLPPEKLGGALPGIVDKATRLALHGAEPRPYSACAAEFLKSRLTRLLESLEELRQQSHRPGGDHPE